MLLCLSKSQVSNGAISPLMKEIKNASSLLQGRTGLSSFFNSPDLSYDPLDCPNIDYVKTNNNNYVNFRVKLIFRGVVGSYDSSYLQNQDEFHLRITASTWPVGGTQTTEIDQYGLTFSVFEGFKLTRWMRYGSFFLGYDIGDPDEGKIEQYLYRVFRCLLDSL